MRGWPGAAINGLFAYALTTVLVATGILLGTTLFVKSSAPPLFLPTGSNFRDAVSNWDGQWYVRIARGGYAYYPNNMSPAAFFPLYPLLGATVSRATGLSADLALLLVSQVFLLGTFILLFRYAEARYPHAPGHPAAYVVLAFAMFPTTFFARVAYSESLFVFLCVLTLFGIQRRWPILAVALLVGLASAARAVGIVLLLPWMLYVWRRSVSGWKAVATGACLLPLAVFGLAAFVAYLGATLGEPLAFVKAQQQWHLRPMVNSGARALALLTLEPIWSTYLPSSPGYWRLPEGNPSAPFSLQFANPIYFLLGIGLILLGIRKGWLSAYETVLGIGLLLAAYVSRGYEMCMASQGRFVGVVFPIYLVLGNLLSRLSPLAAGSLLALCGWYLTVYAALFAAQYFLI